jgi:hypothetical protein
MDRVTISEHDSEAGSWSVARLEPGRSLEPYIGAFYAYDERGTRFAAAVNFRTVRLS